MRNIFTYLQHTMDHGDDIVKALINKQDMDYNEMIAKLPEVKLQGVTMRN